MEKSAEFESDDSCEASHLASLACNRTGCMSWLHVIAACQDDAGMWSAATKRWIAVLAAAVAQFVFSGANSALSLGVKFIKILV